MLFVIGFINGAVLAFLAAFVLIKRKAVQAVNAESEPHEDDLKKKEKFIQQWENFYNYNGSERGQIDV